jgi:hypothetical protein
MACKKRKRIRLKRKNMLFKNKFNSKKSYNNKGKLKNTK